MRIEKTILSNLVFNEEFARKTIPFLKLEYFPDSTERMLFDIIDAYIKKYNKVPSKEALSIDLTNRTDVSEEQYKSCDGYISE